MPQSSLRVVIVDDEEPARLALRQDLAEFEDVTVVAECANGIEAIKVVGEVKPDLLFLDVQMPKLDGFEVLELIGDETPVVFVTAYDEFAVRAFEIHAVDYLLKPCAITRLREAVDRARSRRALQVTPTVLRTAARRPGQPIDRVVIRDGADVHVVPVARIDYVEAQDDYVCVRSGERSWLKEQTLSELEGQLDGRRFVRIHRSYILNIDRLSKVEVYAKDSRVAILHDGQKIPISRSGYQRLQELL